MVAKRQTTFLLITAMTLRSVIFGLNVLHEEPNKLIRHGTLVLGDQNKTISDEMEDDAAGNEGYRDDHLEASVGYQLAERRLRRLRPSVQCNEDSMTLRMTGRRVPRFLVERGEESPVPVSEMPPHCGVSVQRASGDTSLVSRYDACHMTQQGDSYTLPLRMWGAPVKISCPVAAPFTILCTPSAMVIHFGASADAVKLNVNGVWQPMLEASASCGFTLEAKATGWIITAPYTNACWQTEGAVRLLSVRYMHRDLTLSCPLFQAPGDTPLYGSTTTVSTTKAASAQMDYPLPYNYARPWPLYYGYSPVPTEGPTAPLETTDPGTVSGTTVSTPNAGFDQTFPFPYGQARPWPQYYGYSVPTEGPTAPLETTDPGTVSGTTLSTPQASFNQLLYPFPYGQTRPWPQYYGYSPAPTEDPTGTPETTDPTSTSETTLSTPQASFNQMYPFPYGQARPWPLYYGYSPAPTEGPTAPLETTDPGTVSGTTVSTPKAGFDQMYPFPYGQARPWPLYYVNSVPTEGPTAPLKTTDPGTVSGTTLSTPQASFNQMYPFPNAQARPWPLYYSYSPVPTEGPTAPLETTGPGTVSGTTVSTPNAGFDQMFPFPYGQARPWPQYYGYSVPTEGPTAAPETTDPTSTSETTLSTPQASFNQMLYPFPYGQAKPWPLYYGYSPIPTKDTTVPLETTDPGAVSGTTVSTTNAGFDQMYPFPYGQARPWPLYYGYSVPTKDPTAAPETTDPGTTSPKAGADQPIWYPYDYGRPGQFYHDCLPAMSHTDSSQTGQIMFLNKKPWMTYFRRRPRRPGRLDQLCSWPMYYPAKAYNPPQQSSKDVWSYPFIANPVYDQASVNQRWESVTWPAQLSPVQVTAGTTNGESALGSASQTA